jgi:hypothetical protein
MPFETPVPKALIPFFRDGRIKMLLDFAEKFGTGLPFINQLRRMFPNTPGVPNDFYSSLLSYLSQFAKAALQAGDYLTALNARQQIDNNLLPKNFLLRRPDFQMCNQFFRVGYTSRNPINGQEYNVEHGFWEDQYTTAKSLRDRLTSRIQDELDVVATSARASRRYEIVQDSLRFIAAVRLC